MEQYITENFLFCSIYEKIGRGMYSDVFKGRKKKTIEYYAIKSVALSQKRRVHQEVCLRCYSCRRSPAECALRQIATDRCLHFQVKTIHGLEHANILRFYSWYAENTCWDVHIALAAPRPSCERRPRDVNNYTRCLQVRDTQPSLAHSGILRRRRFEESSSEGYVLARVIRA